MEDDELSSYGPLPDPSSRTWRHPSEIAAELAGMSQPNATAGSQNMQVEGIRSAGAWRHASRTTTIGTAAVVVVCLGGLALASVGGRGPLADSINQPDAVLVGSGVAINTPGAGPLVESLGARSASSGSSSAAAFSVVTTQPRLIVADQPAPTNASLTSTTTRKSDPDDGLLAVDTGQSMRGVLPLYASPNQMPIASGLSVDGLILTSASSLGGFDQVHMPGSTGWITLSVVAIDPHTDVAVLEQVEHATQLSPVVTAVGGPVAQPGQLVAILSGHGQPVLAGAEDSADIQYPASIGEVVATGERTTTRDGYEILDTLLTTCRNDDLSGGAALIDVQGHVVGLVVNSEDRLAAALPLDTAIEIGWSLMLDGWRGGAWLGVHGRTGDGGVQLLDLDPKGPAHQAGLRDNDLMTSINGQPLSDIAELLHLLRQLEPGDLIQIQVLRSDQQADQSQTNQSEDSKAELLLFDVALSDRAVS